MWIKICGIRDAETAAAVGVLRPDAIGLNFYAKSARAVTTQQGAAITAALPSGVEPVGVFVNHSLDEIVSICDACGLRTVQLHGDEPPELIEQLRPLRVIRAIRLGRDNATATLESAAALGEGGWPVRALLVDAHVPGSYGGTGQAAPWDLLSGGWRRDWPPLILAGGLTAENVAEAVRAVCPWGIDVAGGVESSPGVKDLDQVARFIEAARNAAGSSKAIQSGMPNGRS